jgi:glucose/arabinose dehydrogenase
MRVGGWLRKSGLWVVVIVLMALVSVTPLMAQEAEEHVLGVQLVAEGMSAPVALASPNDGTNRLFVVDQAGTIWMVSPEGAITPFLDLTGLIVPLRTDYDERGVLGLAFHPDYINNGRFFVYYTAPLRAEAPAGWDHTNVLAEFRLVDGDPNLGDLASQRIILQIDQPQFNHNAGHIAFGLDGYLYVPLGDGGGGNDTDEGHTPGLGNGQDTTNLHGSILRLDVNTGDGGQAYAIPPDNPFVGEDSVADEIYAYGFRNPYHISFDRGGTNQLMASDAGQELYEEVDIVTAGGNFGWNIKEGRHCFDPNTPEQPPAECPTTGAMGEALIDPIIEYGHDVGVVVVGGYIYRGTGLPGFEGHYIFGDYTAPSESPDGVLLWAEPSADDGVWSWGELQVAGMENGRLGMYILGFGEDNNGELYVLTSTSSGPAGTTGKVWRLVPGDAGAGGMTEPGGDMGAQEPAATPEASG